MTTEFSRNAMHWLTQQRKAREGACALALYEYHIHHVPY